MERNRIRYFIIAVILFVLGYLSRSTSGMLWRNLSFLLIAAASYFIFSILFKKAAAWVLVIINLFFHYILQLLSITSHNILNESEIVRFIIGSPFSKDVLFYIFLGTLTGVALELFMRQFNKISMG